MKIPTILGFIMLITAIALGIFIYQRNQAFYNSQRLALIPKKIVVVNIKKDEASILWQTDLPTDSKIIYSDSQNLSLESQDPRGPSPKRTHFVNLTNLQPNKTYFYKIKTNDDFYYPDNPLTFKTGPITDSSPQNNQSIQGTILDENLSPIDEALILLQIDGAQTLGTFTSISGNFVIPLKDLLNSQLDKNFPLSKTDAQLIIQKPNIQSMVDIKLPLENPILPPLSIAQNLDLRDYKASSTTLFAPPSNYDLNGDNKVNSLDLAIVVENIGTKPKNQKADLNSDGVVDQKDLNLLQPEFLN